MMPKIVYIKLFESCNANCIMCDCSKKDIPNVIHSKLFSVIHNLLQLNVKEVRITGGEPLLYTKLEELIEQFSNNKIRVRIMTNGFFLTHNRLKSLVQAGMNELFVSLDGSNFKTHDYIRGVPNLFNRIIKGLIEAKRLSEKYELLIGVTSIIMSNNYRQFINIFNILNNIGCDFWAWNIVKDRPNYLLSISQIYEFYEIAYKIKEMSINSNLKLILPLEYDDKINVKIYGVSDEEIKRSVKGIYPANVECKVLENMVYLDMQNSMIYPCPCTIYRNKTLGRCFDFNNNRLDLLWKNNEYKKVRFLFSKFSQTLCKGCEPALRFFHQNLERLD